MVQQRLLEQARVPGNLLPSIGDQRLSAAEQQTFNQLLAAGASHEHLRRALENRWKRPSIQSGSSTPPSIEAGITGPLPYKPVSTEPRRRPLNPIKRTTYVLNPYPEYQPPAWIGKTPPITQSLLAAAQKNLTVSFWNYLHALRKLQGRRLGISSHRARALEAIVPCLLATMNVSSLQCFVCVKSIAVQCGLTVSRVSRALTDLLNAGLLNKKLKRDRQGHYQALSITLTRKVLKVFGVSESRLNQAQKMHKKLSKAANQALSSSKIVIDTAAESLVTFKRAIQQQTMKILPKSPNGAVILAGKIEEMLRTFGLKQECTSSG